MEDDVVEWITINHQHVPIKKGESKREAVSKFVNKKMSRVERNKDKYDKIAKFKKRKATNNKFDDNEEYKYKVSKDGNRYELDKEQRREVYKKLGIDKYSQDINDYEVKGNTYIPIREGEDRKKVLQEYDKRESRSNINKIKELQDREQALQSGYHVSENDDKEIARAKKEKGTMIDYDRRANLMKFTQNNREQIDKWVKEYDDETHNRVREKVLNQQPLTAKEYFGFLGSDMKPGSIIGEEFPDGEDAIVANDGNWVRKSRIKEYNKNPKANQDAVFSRKDEEEWERMIDKETKKIERFKKRKASNK